MCRWIINRQTPHQQLSFYTLHPLFSPTPTTPRAPPIPISVPLRAVSGIGCILLHNPIYFFVLRFSVVPFFWGGGWRDGNRMKHPPRHSSTHVTPQYPPYSLLPNLDLGRDRNHLTDVQGRVGRGLYMDQGWVVGEHSWCCPLFVFRFYHRPCLQYRSVPPPPVWGTSPSLLLVNTLTTGYGEKGERT